MVMSHLDVACRGMACQQVDGESLGFVGRHFLAIYVDTHEQTRGVKVKLGALVVAGRRAYASDSIAIHREAMDVQLSASDTFKRFTLAPYAET